MKLVDCSHFLYTSFSNIQTVSEQIRGNAYKLISNYQSGSWVICMYTYKLVSGWSIDIDTNWFQLTVFFFQIVFTDFDRTSALCKIEARYQISKHI